MSIVTVERYEAPSTVRAARRLEGAGSRAVDHLAGRTVWCAGTAPAGRDAALALQDCLLWAGDGGVESSTLGIDALADADLRPDDVVVVHDRLAAALAHAIRERGAHLVVRIEQRFAAADDDELVSAVDAYLATWLAPQRGLRVERIAAVVPCSGAVATLDVAPGPAAERRHDLGWSSALRAAVASDRADAVGGTRHARPRVASR
jgi:hypothetical protein